LTTILLPKLVCDMIIIFGFEIYFSKIHVGSIKGRREKVCFVWNWVRSFTFLLFRSYSHVLWTPLCRPKTLLSPHFKSPNGGNHQNSLWFHRLHRNCALSLPRHRTLSQCRPSHHREPLLRQGVRLLQGCPRRPRRHLRVAPHQPALVLGRAHRQ